MKNIVEIRKLKDNKEENCIRIGIDLDTGEIHYYTHYDKTGLYHNMTLYEFDINNPGYVVYYYPQIINYKNNNPNGLPKEIIGYGLEAINKHIEYNKANNLPVNDEQKLLYNGDVIYILGLKIIIMK